MALNLAPLGRWTLRDTAAQRRVALIAGVMNRDHLIIEPMGLSGGYCDCCGHESQTVWGNIIADGAMVACYFVHWTRGQPGHYPNLDFLIGSWRENSKNDRVLVSWLYSASRPAARSDLCSQALTRDQVLSNPQLVGDAKAVLDAVWLRDGRIKEVKA